MRLAFAVMALALSSLQIGAEEINNNHIPFVQGAAQIDGKLDDAVWLQANKIELEYETDPTENAPALVKTSVYLYENGETLYIAFDAKDPDPSQIRAYLRDRDKAYSDDFVGIVIDTFNDKRRAFEFFVNPLGVQMDLTQDDINQQESDAWDAIWDSNGKINGDGFIVEIAIPLRVLRFVDSAEAKQWGIDLLRFYPRDKRYRLSNNKQDRNKSCYLCKLATFTGMKDARPGKNIEIVPSLTAARADKRDVQQHQPWQNGDVETEAGVDFRWGVTPDTSLNLTLNPDFSQVESDVLQLDVTTQFALFYPEKRPFFLEGEEYFKTPLNIVHTRNISDPDYGVKFTGRQGSGTYGVFFADDTTTQFLLPGPYGSSLAMLDQSSNNAAVRYRHDFNNAINVGVLATDRRGDDYANRVAGLDGKFRLGDSDAVLWQWLQSRSDNPEQLISDGDVAQKLQRDDAYFIDYTHQDRHWRWYAREMNYGKDFRADLGFMPRADFRMDVLGLAHTWQRDNGSRWHRIRLNGDWDRSVDEAGNELEEEVELYLGINGPMQSYFEFGGGARDRRWRDVVYRENFRSLYFQMDPVSGLHIEVFNRFGDQIDFANGGVGRLISTNPDISWNVTRHLTLNLAHTYSRLRVDGGELFTSNLSDARLTWQFNNRSFVRLTLQRGDKVADPDLYDAEVNKRKRDLHTQLLYSYKINPQTVFFAGYSDGAIDDDNLNGLSRNERSLFSKISYAFIP